MTGNGAAAKARALIEEARTAALATLTEEGGPYASLVTVATERDLAPVLLLSDLSRHSANIARDPRVSLLIDGTAGFDDPLEGPRMTILGRAAPTEDPAARQAFLARHPPAARYAGFGDFRFFRVEVARIHLVLGFGRVRRLTRDALRGESSQ